MNINKRTFEIHKIYELYWNTLNIREIIKVTKITKHYVTFDTILIFPEKEPKIVRLHFADRYSMIVTKL